MTDVQPFKPRRILNRKVSVEPRVEKAVSVSWAADVKAAPSVTHSAAESIELATAPQGSERVSLKEEGGFGMMETSMKTMTDVTDFAKGNVEAVIESAKLAAAGAETLTSTIVENSRKSFEDAQAAFKTFAAVKSPAELFQAQNDFAKGQFDKAVANWSQLTESFLKLSGEVVQPLSTRVALATDSVKKNFSA